MADSDWQQRVRSAEAILFDFDGTLAPNLDLPDLRRLVLELTRSRGIPEVAVADRYIVEIVDAGAQWLAARDGAGAAAYHADAHTLISDFEVAAAGRTQPFPEIRDALTVLARKGRDGRALGVVTRNCRAAVEAVFPDVGEYCQSVLTRDDVRHLKPDVRHLEQALEELRRTAASALMVGDGQLDMHFGKSLGLFCVGVLTGSSDSRALLAAGADVVLPRASDLAAALD